MILKLKEIRIDKGLLQKDIAKILGISEYTYSHYETQYAIIPLKHLIAFCNYFHVAIDYVFGLTEQKSYQNMKADIDYDLIAKNLKNFRKEKKLTQEKLAKILNIGNGTIADYERGRYLIATPFLYTICNKYHISSDYLLGRIDKDVPTL